MGNLPYTINPVFSLSGDYNNEKSITGRCYDTLDDITWYTVYNWTSPDISPPSYIDNIDVQVQQIMEGGGGVL